MKKEYMLACSALLLWSTLPAVSKMLINRLDPIFTSFCVMFIAAVILLVINLVRGGIRFYMRYSPRDYLKISGLGLLGVFCYTVLYYYGLSRLTSQVANILNYMWPIMTVVFSCLILKERMTWKKVLALGVTFCGIVLVSAQGLFGGHESNSIPGMVCCFAAAACYGLYSVLNKKYNYNQWIVLNVAFGITALLSGIISAVQGTVPEPEVFTLPMIAGMLWIGIFINALAYVMWGKAINSGETSKIVILAYICPFLSILFGRLLLDEHISMTALMGLVLIVGGIMIQVEFHRSEK